MGIDLDAPAIRRRLDEPLIGREAEVGLLRATFARVSRRRAPELLTVVGEAGIGKSRLVAELATIAGADGTVLTGRCPAYGEGITFWPLREVVLQALAHRSVAELAAALEIPAVAVRRVAAAVGLEEGEAGEDTDWAFLQLIGALARVRPLVIVVDDAQWAEPALLDLLLAVLARLRDAPVLVVWVARQDQLERTPEQGAELVLQSLSRTASESLVAVARRPLEPAEERRIIEAAGGNPLFLEQLVAYIGERPSAGALPPALQTLLAARLDGLAAASGPRSRWPRSPATASPRTRSTRSPRESRSPTSSARPRGSSGATSSYGSRMGCASATRSSATPPTPRSPSPRGPVARAARGVARERAGRPEADARIGFHLEAACRFAPRSAAARPRARGAGGSSAWRPPRAGARPRRPHGRDRLPGPCGGAAGRRGRGRRVTAPGRVRPPGGRRDSRVRSSSPAAPCR